MNSTLYNLQLLQVALHRKYNMQIQSGNSWSQILKSSVVCLNSTMKKSYDTTPFRVIWGRDSRYQDLVPSLNNVAISAEENIETEEAIFSLYDVQPDDSDAYSPPQEQPQESIAILDNYRRATCELAGENIGTEQLKQKRQCDKKVTQHR